MLPVPQDSAILPEMQRTLILERALVALPVYNEVAHVTGVLDEVRRFAPQVLVVNDGSVDGTAELLANRRDVAVVTHPRNLGYGAALRSAFDYARQHEFEFLVTVDCDGQHQPRLIPEFVRVLAGLPTVELPFTPARSPDPRPIDLVSGSRYLKIFDGDSHPPVERRRINVQITAELNDRLGLRLTDAFCGFKGYRVAALAQVPVTEPGYAMPLEFWVRAAAAGLRIEELPVPLIYLEEARSFGGALDDSLKRLAYYQDVIERAFAATRLSRARETSVAANAGAGVPFPPAHGASRTAPAVEMTHQPHSLIPSAVMPAPRQACGDAAE
ncbi:MAG: glycosyltransferase family 2 protein [Pirellulales bacterium]|nr:glycosyltransferase family 2 protein [Pirellulales bacterium]